MQLVIVTRWCYICCKKRADEKARLDFLTQFNHPHHQWI